jgi:hypothetical protein
MRTMNGRLSPRAGGDLGAADIDVDGIGRDGERARRKLEEQGGAAAEGLFDCGFDVGDHGRQRAQQRVDADGGAIAYHAPGPR